MGCSTKSSDRLIIALDVPDTSEAESIVSMIGETASFYKIGYHLAFSGGLELARDLVVDGKQIFLDMKLLDIDNTVAKGIENIVETGAAMTTVHAYPKVMKAAVEAAQGSNLCLLAVSVLTSMDDQDLHAAGYETGTKKLVKKRVRQAFDMGMGGVVASAHEAGMIRTLAQENQISNNNSGHRKKLAIVTPGIRLNGSPASDQKRIMTPKDAILAGASHIVAGRLIINSDDKKMTTKIILDEMETAMNSKN